MAPDSFEADQRAFDADISNQPEAMTPEPQPVVSRPVRRSLFQIVCLQADPSMAPAGKTSL
jgi:hypothetical protein